jgi:hypothetical protein
MTDQPEPKVPAARGQSDGSGVVCCRNYTCPHIDGTGTVYACGAVDPATGTVCVTLPHAPGSDHLGNGIVWRTPPPPEQERVERGVTVVPQSPPVSDPSAALEPALSEEEIDGLLAYVALHSSCRLGKAYARSRRQAECEEFGPGSHVVGLIARINQLRAENQRLRQALATAIEAGCPHCGHGHESGEECGYLLCKSTDTQCDCKETYLTSDQLRSKVAELEAGVLDGKVIDSLVSTIIGNYGIGGEGEPVRLAEIIREEIARRKRSSE